MSEANDKEAKVADQSFDEYMMYSLESSESYSMKMHERSQQAINYYLGLFTALVTGGVVVLTTVTTEPLKSLILMFDLALIIGVGTLTYLWILVSIGNTRQEDCIQFFLHKYFRDKDPISFDRYGLSELSTVYRNTYDKKYSPTTMLGLTAPYLSLIVLIIFNSCLSGCAGYLCWNILIGKYSLLVALILGTVYFFITIIIWLIIRNRVLHDYAKGLAIFKKYHHEQ